MATTYLSPGVYIEEVDKGTKPIQGVPTAITAFIGFTEIAERVNDDGYTTRSILSQPQLVTNWGQYQQHFGGLVKDAYMPHSVRGFFDNGGSICHVISIRTLGKAHAAQALLRAPHKDNPELGDPSLLIHAKATDKNGKAIDGNKVSVKVSRATNTVAGATAGAGATNGGTTGTGTTAGTGTGGTTGTPGAGGAGGAGGTTAGAGTGGTGGTGGAGGTTAGAGTGGTTNGGNGYSFQMPALTIEVFYDKKSVQTATVPVDQLKVWNKRSGGAGEPVEFEYVDVWSLPDYEPFAKMGRLVKDEEKGKVLLKKVLEAMPADDNKTLIGGTASLDLDLLDSPPASMAGIDDNEVFQENSLKLFEGDMPKRKGIASLDAIDNVNLICAPDLMMAYQKGWVSEEQLRGIQQAMLDHCRRMSYRFAILDAPPKMKADDILNWRMNIAGYDSMHGALYYPWIKIPDPVSNGSIFVPPCGHMAGIYARSDDERGVHKAPANEVVAGVIDIENNVTKGEQDLLNPVGINCIRKFSGRGIRVWGARTLSSDPSWRYINVRRLFNYVEESVERSTQWIVFEPNDHILWAKVRRDITAFLRTVWLSGALFGTSPEKAFYVKCDEETNLPELRDLGQMVCEIGMAPVKPAEFVIFRFSQWAADTEV